MRILRTYSIVGGLAALTVLGVMLGIFLSPASSITEAGTATNTINAHSVASSEASSSLLHDVTPTELPPIDEIIPPFVRDDDEYTKSFLIAYPLAIPVETANKVSINGYPWLSKLVRNGEAIISSEELKDFVNRYEASPDFAILMEDGETTKYFNINWSQDILIPNVPYVKAYWEGVIPAGVASERVDISHIPALKEAIEDKSLWIPLDNPSKAIAVEQLLKNTNNRHYEVTLQDGTVEAFHIRYIDASHTEITG